MAKRANEVKLIVDGRVPDEWIDHFPTRHTNLFQPEGNKEQQCVAVGECRQGPSTALSIVAPDS